MSSRYVLALVLCLPLFASGDDEARGAATNRMASIVIPEIDFRGANINDIIDFMSQASREYDRRSVAPEEKGVNFVLNPRVTSGGGVPLLTFSAREITLLETLRLVSEVADLGYSVRRNTVMLADRRYLKAVETPIDETSAVEARLGSAVIPEITLDKVDVARAVASLNELTRDTDAERAEVGPLIELDLQQTNAEDWPEVDLVAKQISALHAARIVADLAEMELWPEENRMSMRPAKAQLAGEPETVVAGVTELTLETYPRVDSSTSAQPLQALCACRLLGPDPVWRRGRNRKTFNELRLSAAAVARAGDSPDEHRERVARAELVNGRIHVSGTHGAYVNLVRDRADLILVARSPSEDELNMARARGLRLDVRPVALDAFVFIVNVQNPVTNLTSEALRSIYTGGINDWQEVGGPPGDLKAFQRNRNSGSQELMEKLVMRGLTPVERPETMILKGMGGPFNRIAGDPQGLGYSVLFYERRMNRKPGTQLIAVDGVFPSAENVRLRRYPYVTEVFVVTRADLLAGTPAAVLRDWLLSPAGQAVVAQSGYVPLPR